MADKVGFQHYVPKFYLARFTDKDGKLWVFDKTTDRIFPVMPSNIAGENGFYDIETLVPPGADLNIMEKQLAYIESEVSLITADWIYHIENYGKVMIPPVNRKIMSLFITLQMLRTAEARAILVQFTQDQPSISKNYDSVKDAAGLHAALLWDERTVNRITKKVGDCLWMFAKTDGKSNFYTSDHPVLIHVRLPQGHLFVLTPSVFYLGMNLVYPLSPNWVMYCYDMAEFGKVEEIVPDGSVSPVVLTGDMVDHENTGQVGRSLRFVFSNSPDFTFAKEYLAAHPALADPSRRRIL